jgi:hypothetical protein
MPTTSPAAARTPATLPLFLPSVPTDKVSGLFHAATLLAQLLGQGRALDSRALRSAMEAAFAVSDAEGPGYGKTPARRSKPPRCCSCANSAGAMRARLAQRLPSQTRRSEESEHLPEQRQALPRIRSISLAETLQTCATRSL